MTLQQKLREDLQNEMLEIEKATRQVETAQANLKEHQIRLRYIKDCLSLGSNNQPAAPERKIVENDDENGSDIQDIERLVQRAFESGNRKMRVTDVVKRLIQGGYGSQAEHLKVSKNVGAFLMRRAKKPDGGYKRLSRGLFEYVGESSNGNGTH